MSHTMDRNFVKMLRVHLDSALKGMNLPAGVTLQLGSCRFDPTNGKATFKLDARLPGCSKEDEAAKNFKQCGYLLCGLKPEDLNTKTFNLNGQTFVVTGYLPRKRKNSVAIKRVKDGKAFVTSPETVKRLTSPLKLY